LAQDTGSTSPYSLPSWCWRAQCAHYFSLSLIVIPIGRRCRCNHVTPTSLISSNAINVKQQLSYENIRRAARIPFLKNLTERTFQSDHEKNGANQASRQSGQEAASYGRRKGINGYGHASIPAVWRRPLHAAGKPLRPAKPGGFQLFLCTAGATTRTSRGQENAQSKARSKSAAGDPQTASLDRAAHPKSTLPAHCQGTTCNDHNSDYSDYLAASAEF